MINVNLLDTMFTKLFCLPSNSNIELYENGIESINNGLCHHYNHISCIFEGNGLFRKLRVLSYGINRMGDSDGIIPGVHAEQDSIAKLPSLKKKKRLKNINILVIRLSGRNKLQTSKPCHNCINVMKMLPIKKGYNIQNIFYSNEEGNIIKTSLIDLDKEEHFYSKYYKQNKPDNCS